MVSATTALPGIICAGWNAKGPRLLAGARRGDTVIPWANRPDFYHWRRPGSGVGL